MSNPTADEIHEAIKEASDALKRKSLSIVEVYGNTLLALDGGLVTVTVKGVTKRKQIVAHSDNITLGEMTEENIRAATDSLLGNLERVRHVTIKCLEKQAAREARLRDKYARLDARRERYKKGP